MIIDGVLILYTNNPKPAAMQVLSTLLGREVYLAPLSQRQVKKKAAVSAAVVTTLPQVHPN